MAELARGVLAYLRFRGHAGRLITRHRSLRRIDLDTRSRFEPFALALVGSVATWLALEPLAHFWVLVLQLWMDSLGLDTVVHTVRKSVGPWFDYPVPSLRLAAPPVSHATWSLTLAITLGAMLVSYLWFRHRLPLVYLTWALGLIQLSSLTYFVLFAERFPHSIQSHVETGMEMNAVLILLTPLLLSVSLYPFRTGLPLKLGATIGIVSYLALLAPCQYAVHVLIAHTGSLLFLPVLFIVFGIILDIFVFVALYALAMSFAKGPAR